MPDHQPSVARLKKVRDVLSKDPIFAQKADDMSDQVQVKHKDTVHVASRAVYDVTVALAEASTSSGGLAFRLTSRSSRSRPGTRPAAASASRARIA